MGDLKCTKTIGDISGPQAVSLVERLSLLRRFYCIQSGYLSPDSCGVICIGCLSFKDDVDFYSLYDYAARASYPMILPIAILCPHVTW